MILKKSDYVIISLICFFLGIFLISQVYAGKEARRVIQPENNEVIALEIAKLNRTTADLRREIKDLTAELNTYRNSSESSRTSNERYRAQIKRLSTIIGIETASGQGVKITIKGGMTEPQIIDLINAIKNIGSEIIAINNTRLVLQTDLGQFKNRGDYEIMVLGNSNLLKSAMERKGGIVEQISTKEISVKIEEAANLTIPAGETLNFNYAKIIKE